jgi:hypothetical protein
MTRTEKNILELMHILDTLIVEDDLGTQHEAIIEVLCWVLKKYWASLGASSVTEQENVEVKDPCISVLVSALTSVDPPITLFSNEQYPVKHRQAWEKSLSRIFEGPNVETSRFRSIRLFILTNAPPSWSRYLPKNT